MFKKTALILMALAAPNVSYADAQPLTIQQVPQEIDSLFSNKKYAECILLIDQLITFFRTVLRDNPEQIQDIDSINKALLELWLLRARCHINMNLFHEALDDCDKALQKDKNYGYAYFVKAVALFKLNKEKKAIEYLKIAAKKGFMPAQVLIAQYRL